ncbi:ferredoxin reductase-like C-terminal NADP-linked domain-containing protein [Lentinula detonsa]|uniref:Ferredoxin reductase-like C-terminal NADP-linked domain-containing protein n=1 Tax=Lentinula detonsa TaxID=2804962 RepID=A0A9W8TWI1_9AGAR|nr:ferredoxin reductase-like C-terminal NADP-linked domain-containing protein [Lentinula detonsa]
MKRPTTSHFRVGRQYSTILNTRSRNSIRPLAVGTVLSFGALASYYFFFPDASRGAPTSKHEKLSPSHFTPCTITSSEPCGPNTRLITLKIPPKFLPASDEKRFSSIWSIFVKDDDIQVERPYTPLEGVDAEGQMRFWIKKYPHGEVSRWLHSKEVGDEIEIRGPLQTWLWKDDDVWDEVVMISGGTGIAPFYQLFHDIISQGVSPRTKFTLLHSSRSPSELPPSAILLPLSSFASENPKRFQFRVFVDTLDPTDEIDRLKVNVGRINRATLVSSIKEQSSPSKWWMWPLKKSAELDIDVRKTLFLLCGPEPMITALSGPYGRNFSQGPVGGVLEELSATSSQVYKF